MVCFLKTIFTLPNRVSHKGQNLILNMNDKGFTVVAYNRTTSKVDAFLANEAKGGFCCYDLMSTITDPAPNRYKNSRRTHHPRADRQTQETPQDYPPCQSGVGC